MPLSDHLRELRNRIVKMVLALVAGMVVGFVFFAPVWRVIERPLCAATIRGQTGCDTLGVNRLVLNGPLDAFYLRVKVALIVGVILSSPVWLYQVWAFIAPGLYAREKRWGHVSRVSQPARRPGRPGRPARPVGERHAVKEPGSVPFEDTQSGALAFGRLR